MPAAGEEFLSQASGNTPRGLQLERRGAPEEMAVDESRSTSDPQELKLTGQDITDRPELPYPVGLQGFHSGRWRLSFLLRYNWSSTSARTRAQPPLHYGVYKRAKAELCTTTCLAEAPSSSSLWKMVMAGNVRWQSLCPPRPLTQCLSRKY